MKPEDRPGSSRNLTPNAGKHIRAIVEAAERAAESIVDDAEAQANRYLADARADADRAAAERLAALSDQIDALLEQAEALKKGAERLAGSLERARNEAESGSEVSSESAARGSHLAAVAPIERPQPGEPPLDDGDALSAERAGRGGARLLATQMAVSGSSREEIAERLRNGFEIDDTAAILDAILGPED
jgi:hypothetical protein